MSSLLDVPTQLALVLSLAASAAGHESARPSMAVARSAQSTLLVEPLEGPFRFGERNWLRTLKEDMAEDGASFAPRIFKTSGGRYYVPAAEERRQILSARSDAALAKRAAEAAARRNAQMLSAALRRPPAAGDLFLAHVLGPEAAISFINMARSKPDAEAARQSPELMALLPTLSLGQAGRLTLAEVYKHLTAPLAAYEPGARMAAPSVASGPDARSGADPKSAYARTMFVSEAIDWRPQVSAAGPTTNQ